MKINNTKKQNKLKQKNNSTKKTIKNIKLCSVLPPTSHIVNLDRVKRYDSKTMLYIDENNKQHLYNLEKTTELSRGSYGKVVLLKSNTTKQTFVAKLFFKDTAFNDEYNNIMLLKDYNIHCRLIDGIPLQNMVGFKNILIMNTYDGDLTKLRKTLQPEQYEAFILEVLRMFNCLVEKDVGYLDIKLQNILYKCVENSEFMMKIGDIGSITILNKEYGIVSYVPFEYKDTSKETLTTESAMVFLIAVMFLGLFTDHKETRIFHYSNFKNETTTSYLHKVFLLIYKYKLDTYTFKNGNPYLDMFLNMLSPDPKERASIQEIIEYVSDDYNLKYNNTDNVYIERNTKNTDDYI